MGAQLWHEQAPWHPDPDTALRQLQAKFVADNYDLPSYLADHLKSVRDALGSAQADGDPYGLADTYTEELQHLERPSSQPIPDAPEGQVELVRQICRYRGEGVGNILDVTQVADRRGYPLAQRLEPADIERLVGTQRPTVKQAQDAAYKINEELNRGEAVCFPMYDRTGKPVGWYFVGNTID